MQVNSINFLHFNTKNIKPLYIAGKEDIIDSSYKNNFASYPKNYQPYFGARIDRSPQNFYAQKFNIENMPITVKNYLNSDFKNNSLKKPVIIQREAFEDLSLCENANDVKEMYPDEPLFKDLKSLDEISPRRGYLHDLKVLQDDDNHALKSKEDITIYLLKKIYLEGKTLEEINEDFKLDANSDFLDDANYSKNGYFQSSTLDALGISFPNIAYWHSFQATRPERYRFIGRTIDPNKERKPRVFTDEQRAKQSQRMIARWAFLSEEEKARRIEKLRSGLSENDNILLQYMSPIMIIAAEKVGLSEKMVEFYNKYSMTEDLPEDISNLSKDQSEKLQKFWNENPQLKKDFSKAISETIEFFREKRENGQINEFLSLAVAIKLKNESAAYLRKMSTESEIKKTILEAIDHQFEYYPEAYTGKYTEFLLNHPKLKTDFMPLYRKTMCTEGAEKEKYKKLMQQSLYSLHSAFIKKYKYETNAANMAMMSVIYDVISDYTLFTAASCNIISAILDNNLDVYMKNKKSEIESRMKAYTVGFSDEEMKNICQSFCLMMQDAGRNGYKMLADEKVRARARILTKMAKQIEKNKFYRNKFKDFIKNYEPQIRYATEPTTSQHIKLYLLESIMDDATIELSEK